MSTFDRQAVIESLSRLVTPGIKLTALADELGARKHEYGSLRSLMVQMVEEGSVLVLPGGAFALAPRGRAADRRAAKHKPDQRGEEYDPPDEPFVNQAPAAPKPKTRPALAPKSAKRQTALPWGKSAPQKHAVPPPLKPKVASVVPAYDPDTGEVSATAKDTRTIGRITVHPAGYGFVAIEGAETVFVPAKYRNLSLDGDRVAVDTWPGVRGTEGRVTEVLARGRARLTGILRRVGRAVYLEPDDPRIAADFGRVHMDDAPTGKDGDAIVVEITRYPDAARRELAAKLLKVLGDPEDPRTEIEKILACAMIPLEFPDDAILQAKATPQEVGPDDLANRLDLRDRRFATIDPETARDFDDALCIEDGPHGGPRVWVAVADVSHYVRWDDALDKEAAIRGVSVYLPDRVIPMLPQQLSAQICSLNPQVDRCAMVVRLDYTPEGDVENIGYAAAVIRSKGRLDYPGVAAALGGDFRGRREEYRGWITELTRLNALARMLRAKRQARGALELDLPEPKVILDADDPRLVRDVVKAKGDPAVKQAYQLVEEFMIAANEAVGKFFRQRNVPSVWRVHAPPKEDRVKQLAELLGAYGIIVDVEAAVTPLGMKVVLDQIEQKPGAQALSMLVLRTLTQAVWDTVPIGHFGLASGDYLHFTSPIRRYPDLLVHRLLKSHLHKDGQPSGVGYTKPPPPVETLTELAHASSGHERRAMEAEREAVSMYRAYMMRDQVGEEFEGTVSAVTSFGAFVELDEPYVEGLIKLESLGDEPFSYDAVHMRLSGNRTGRSIELGDKVKVKINNVSVIRRRIDFTLLATAQSNKRRPTLEANPRAGIVQRKKAGAAAEQAVRGRGDRTERGARPARTERPERRERTEGARSSSSSSGGGGKLRLGVSHRGTKAGGKGKKPKR